MAKTTLTVEQAAEHLDRAWNEAQRLQEHFSQRSREEKKRLGVLQQVVPKLKRLSRGAADVHVDDDELIVLQALVPTAAEATEKPAAAPAKAAAPVAVKAAEPAKKPAAKAAAAAAKEPAAKKPAKKK